MARRRSRGMIAGAIVAALAVGMVATALAQTGARRPFGLRMMGPGAPPLGIELPLRQLDVSEAQREQMRSIVEAHAAQARTLAERARAAREALREAITAEVLDEALVRQRAADVAAVEADLAVLRAQIHQQVFAVLTPEQQQKARDLRAQAQERLRQRLEQMRERRQRGRVPGGDARWPH